MIRWPHLIGAALLGVLMLSPTAWAADKKPGLDNAGRGSQTGLPLPRYVSLAKSKVNLRAGPSTRYPIRWVYHQRGLPVEIVREYDHWRKIRDWDGDEGWVHKALLTGRRHGMVTPETIDILKKPLPEAPLAAQATKGAILGLESCDLSWCEIRYDRLSGFVRRNQLWGLYQDEIIGQDD